jgi:hypothetical protein
MTWTNGCRRAMMAESLPVVRYPEPGMVERYSWMRSSCFGVCSFIY